MNTDGKKIKMPAIGGSVIVISDLPTYDRHFEELIRKIVNMTPEQCEQFNIKEDARIEKLMEEKGLNIRRHPNFKVIKTSVTRPD